MILASNRGQVITPHNVRIAALLGEYPNTRALRTGQIVSPAVTLDFADVKVPNAAFKRAVRDLEFDVAELALVTFLMAKATGKPLVLLPAVLFSRDPLQYLVHNAECGPLTPDNLAGRRIGVRSYTTTTAVWIRGILANEFRVPLDRLHWITLDEGHVAEFADPPNVERAPAGSTLPAMLLDGRIDAAIVDPVPADPRVMRIVPDSAVFMRDWERRHHALTINHIVVVKATLSKSHPAVVREVFRLLSASKAAAGPVADPDPIPLGLEANRRSLEIAIDYTYQQGLIARRLSVDELVDDVTAALE